MGKINKNSNVYTTNNTFITTGDNFIEKGIAPVSTKYPGGNTAMTFNAAKGKHVGSHKPIKNHRNKTIKRV